MENTNTPNQVISEVAKKMDELQQAVLEIALAHPELTFYCRQAAEHASELNWLLDILVQEM